MKLSNDKLLSYNSLTDAEFDMEIEKGFSDLMADKVLSAEEVRVKNVKNMQFSKE